MWLVVEQVASDLAVPPEAAVRILFAQVAAMLEQGQAGYLGPLFERALKTVRQANFGAIGSGPAIDLSKLAANPKIKSGYVGVYANGNGFRAMGKKPGGIGEQYIGSFPTAEEAAWKRYCYYKEHGLPYGEMEDEIREWRARGEQGTDLEIAERIRKYAASVGTLHHFDPEGEDTSDASAGTGLLGFDPDTASTLLNGGG